MIYVHAQRGQVKAGSEVSTAYTTLKMDMLTASSM